MLSIPKYPEQYAQHFPTIFYLLCCASQHHVKVPHPCPFPLHPQLLLVPSMDPAAMEALMENMFEKMSDKVVCACVCMCLLAYEANL